MLFILSVLIIFAFVAGIALLAAFFGIAEFALKILGIMILTMISVYLFLGLVGLFAKLDNKEEK